MLEARWWKEAASREQRNVMAPLAALVVSLVVVILHTPAETAAQESLAVQEAERLIRTTLVPLAVQRVDVHMEYDLRPTINEGEMPRGRAAVEWTTLREARGLSEAEARIAVAGFLYARTIVAHEETRRNLLERTEQAAIGLEKGADRFLIDAWQLDAGGLRFPIYPWQHVSPQDVRDARTYTAYLIEMSAGGVGGHLDMAWGAERVLAPAAPLIVFEDLARTLSDTERVRLGRVIHLINEFYGRVDLEDTARLIGTDVLVTRRVVGFLRDEGSFASQGGEAERIINKQDADYIFGLDQAGWDAYAQQAKFPEGWKAGYSLHDTGTAVMAIDPTTGIGLSVQPFFDQKDGPPVALIVGSYYPPGYLPEFTDEIKEGIERESMADLGPKYSVTASRVQVQKYEGIELMVTRVP